MNRAGLAIGVMMLSALGCAGELFRLQSDDDEKTKERDKAAAVKTVGEAVSIWGAHPVRVYGVGVVKGLHGTGSDPQPSELRRNVIHELKTRGCPDPVGFLASPDTAIVTVMAYVTPGLQAGDTVDAEVEFVQGDRATSLRGGVLISCDLYEVEDAHKLRGGQGSHGGVKGRVIAKASGPIITGLGDPNDKERLRRGRIMGGARLTIDRNFALLTNKEYQDARIAKQIADRINSRFYGHLRGTVKGMAEAKDKYTITLKVPAQYRLNWPRYLRIVKHIPLSDSPVSRDLYRQKLVGQLGDPGRCIAAALRLEALGPEVRDDLKLYLRHEHPLVSFCAAEALAYLNEPCAGEPLARLITLEPRLQAYGLTALASLDQAVSHVELKRLMSAPSAKTRYGAFRALRVLDDREPALGQEEIGDKVYLHVVCGDEPSVPLVHASTARRAEIVLFGPKPRLLPPFALQAGPDFTVTAREGETRCFVARFSAKDDVSREPCPLELEEIIRLLAEMGAEYADLLELLQRAAKDKCLSCRLEIDATPDAVSVYQLVAAGLRDAATQRGEANLSLEDDFGLLPNLFARPTLQKPQ